MRQIIRVVQIVSDLLPTEGMGPEDRNLVLTYIRWRELAASRLAAFTAALESGDTYRALQITEMEPPLPDFIAHLGLVSHLGSQGPTGRTADQQWAIYCRKHGLPLPPALDPDAIQKMHDLYRQGITTDSPFYQECLAAIAAGDEDKALGLIRSIVRLGRDQDARAHMERMLRKKSAPQLAALRICLEQGHEDGVIGWLDEFERSGAESLLADDTVHAAAVEARKMILTRRATAEAGTILAQAAAHAKSEDWPTVTASVTRIQRLESEWGLHFPPQQIALFKSLEKLAAEYQARVRNQEAFNQALGALMTFAEGKYHLLQEKQELPLAELRKAQEELADLWKRVDAFNLSIPPRELDRLHHISEVLQQQLMRRIRLNRIRKTALMVPVCVLAVALVCAGVLYYRALSQLRQLEELRDGKLGNAASRMLDIMMRSSAGWILNLSPDTRARLESLMKWAKLNTQRLHDIEHRLDELEEILQGPIDNSNPEGLMKKFAAVNELMKDLAHDDLGPVQARLQKLQGVLDSKLKSLLAKNLEHVRKMLVELQKLAQNLAFEKPLAELSPTLGNLRTGLQEVEPLEHPTVPALQFPQEVKAALRALRAKGRLYTSEMDNLAIVREAMNKAGSLTEYKLALEQCALLPFAECRQAAKITATFSNEDETAARMFFRGDLEAWRMAQLQAAKDNPFIPDAATPEELRRLSKIRDDPNLNAPGPARKLLDAMRLAESVDAAGSKIKTPLIEIMDRIFGFPQSDVLVKAYLAREIHEIMQARGFAWGLHYAPEVSIKMAELNSILGAAPLQSGDWNRPDIRKKWQPKLQSFFQAAPKEKKFLDQAVSFQKMVLPVAKRGITYGGFLDEARIAHLKIPDETAQVFWGRSERRQNLVPIQYVPNSAEKQVFRELRMWSPLLIIPLESQDAEGRVTMK